MSVLLDIILPTIIVGMLIVLLFGVQSKMLESSVENRVTREMQGFADLTVQVIHEQARELQELIALTDSTLSFQTFETNTVSISRNGRDLLILTTNGPDTLSAVSHALRLSELHFATVPLADKENGMLRIRVETESTPDQEVGNRTHRHKGFAHRDVYLRNLYLNQ